jgi:hypothetical protein
MTTQLKITKKGFLKYKICINQCSMGISINYLYVHGF